MLYEKKKNRDFVIIINNINNNMCTYTIFDSLTLYLQSRYDLQNNISIIMIF